MRAIQITMDEKLLEALDASDEVQRDGRSAVLRRAASEYLRRQRREAITTQYERAYQDSSGLGDELEGWGEEVHWPK